MNILTKKNGIALIAVLAVLLILTLLIPAMFTMSDNATRSAMQGQDEQRASYFARTMIEFTVGAFQECYDAAEEDESEGIKIPDNESDITDDLKDTDLYKLNQFLKKEKSMDVSILYMYRTNTAYPDPDDVEYPDRNPGESDADYRKRCLLVYRDYMDSGVIYSTTVPGGYTQSDAIDGKIPVGTISNVNYVNNSGEACSDTGYYQGYAKCSVTYDDSVEYFSTWKEDGVWQTEKITGKNAKQVYESYLERAKAAIAANNTIDESEVQVFKVENRNVEFSSYANIAGKGAVRRCILVLPTKPADNSWIVPANIESNQIFPDTSQASSVFPLKLKNNSIFIDEEATNGQPVYGFSCIGNMVVSTKNIKYKAGANDFLNLTYGETMDYVDYITAYNAKVDEHNAAIEAHNAEIDAYNAANPDSPRSDYRNDYMTHIDSNLADFSLGLHPETTTINPERDPSFNCLKTNNMRTWASSAQRDNFVAFTATNGIQFDMPVNLIMNPCRTGRIGDGIQRNRSLYKVLYLQAPTIVFNKPVNNFVSLYTKTSLLSLIFDYNGYRMSSIILAAPESTPYTMEVEKGGEIKTVKAGKVYFAEDAYVWLVPFTENGSNYRTQTVYYKGKDIILYKFANAGDVFLFNSEVETEMDGEMVKAGFSMTGYFMDVIYSKDTTDTNNVKWWQLWSGIQSMIFDSAVSGVRPKTYEAEDLQWVGNMNTGTQGTPNVDDFYVIWES